MKKTNELNLTVGTGLATSPYLKRTASHNGGMTNSADNTFGGVYMSRVNKGYELEEEEYIEDEELDQILQEFDIKGIGRSVFYSIPGIGDAAAAISFLWSYFGPFGLRAQLEGFTEKLSKLSQIDLGEDFLEAEGGDTEDSDEKLDYLLDEVVYRMTHLQDMPQLNVSYEDILVLQKEWDDINDKMRDILVDFIGFIDMFTQQGFILNAAISVTEPEDLADFITREYSDFINQLNDSGKKSMIYNIAKKTLQMLSKPLDYMGNLDLLFNVEKLNRLSKVNIIFSHFKDVESKEEMAALGLKQGRLSQAVSSAVASQGVPEEEREDKENLVTRTFQKVLSILTEHNVSLAELYEDDEYYDDLLLSAGEEDELGEEEIEEMSAGGVAGPAVPLGKNAKGEDVSRSDIDDFHNFARKSYGQNK